MRGAHGHTNGHIRTPTYRSWRSMIVRCYRPKEDSYKYYGGKGVTVCDRWRHDFSAFLEDLGERPQGMTLDRKDSNGHYTPENCRWATATDQSLNKGMYVNNTSGAKGVQWRSRVNRWIVWLSVAGKKTYFGSYMDFDLAELVASEVRRKHHGFA